MKLKSITNNNIYYLLNTLCFIVIISICGCKTKSTLVQPTNKESIEHIISKTEKANMMFTTANISSAYIKVKYGNSEFTFNASIKIIKDSIISVSFMPALGIEVIRLNLYKDKFQVIDKINRKYAENTYEYIKLKYQLGVDYKTIENLVTHQAFSINKNKDYKNWNINYNNDTVVITDNSQILDLYNIQTTLNSENRIIKIAIKNEQQEFLSLNFSDFKQINNISYPSVYELYCILDKIIYTQINLRKIKFNEPISISNLNLSKYDRVALKKIIP